MPKLPSHKISMALTNVRSTLSSGKLFASKLLARRGKGGRNLQVLTAQRDAGLLTTRYNDIVDEARERGNAADEEGDDGTPVASISGRVAVHAVEVIHVGYGHVTASDDEVTAAQDKRISGYGRNSWRSYVGLWETNSVMRMDVMGPRKMV
jgi:hypothetical protein